MRIPGLKNPDMLLTDTVGFIQKLPTNLVAAFRATLEEISEADILLVSEVNSSLCAAIRVLHCLKYCYENSFGQR